MLFESRASALQVIARESVPIYEGGVHVGNTKELLAEFAQHDGEFTVEDEDGRVERHAMIRGHFCDTRLQQEAKGWTDEERDIVEKRLLFYCDQQKEQLWLKEIPAPLPPWPTIAKMPAKQIPEYATALGLVAETLAWVKAQEGLAGKDKLVEDLEVALELAQVEAETMAAV